MRRRETLTHLRAAGPAHRYYWASLTLTFTLVWWAWSRALRDVLSREP